MQLVVISSPAKFDSELKIIPKLFDCGLKTFHLRKPKFSFFRMNEYLSLVPKEYLSKIIIHTHHRLALKYKLKGIHITEKQKKKKIITWVKLKLLKTFYPSLVITSSFHNISDALRDKKKYEYVFLSPIFNSISKSEYKSNFTEELLKKLLVQTNHTIYALGGINGKTIPIAKSCGFTGAAVLGSIWGNENPVEAFMEIRDICYKKNSQPAEQL